MRRILFLINTLLATCALLAAAPATAGPGDLDATFGAAGLGMVMTALGPGQDHGQAIAMQPDGKIVVAGYCHNGSNWNFCLARYQANGLLDGGFGSGGTGTVISPIGSADSQGYAIALQPDGKIIVTGFCGSLTQNDFCLARYQANGSLDPSFGSNGTVTTAFPAPSDDRGKTIALQPDGKIVVAGYCHNGSSSNFCLARYQANGSLDGGFGSGGTVITSISSGGDDARAIALQPDGKIVIAGACYGGGTNWDFCLARYQASGTLDTSFKLTGTVISPIGSSWEYANAIALQPDGKIVVAGFCRGASNDDFCFARYHVNGTIDTTFGMGGTVISPIGSGIDQAYALALQPDGKIVAAGYCMNGSGADFCLARYHSNGTLDTTFGLNGNGKVTTPIGSASDQAFAIALQPDGKIVAAGRCHNGSDWDFCLARYEGGPFDYQNCKLDIDGDGAVLATTDMLIGTRVALGMTGPAVIRGVGFASHATRKTWPAIRNYLVSQCGMTLAP